MTPTADLEQNTEHRIRSVRAVRLIALAQLLVLSLWFSATAVAADLLNGLGQDLDRSGSLTLAVQLGFVAGAVVFALGTVSDRLDSRHMFAASAVFGAAANAAIVLAGSVDDPSYVGVLALRFFTGIALAGAYPSGLKLVAGWTVTRRGRSMGLLIAALTLGSATPHLVGSTGLPWQPVMLVSSALALVGAAIVHFGVEQGPHAPSRSVFASAHLRVIAGNRNIRLATYGYMGHMWELYALWTWVGVWLAASDWGRNLEPTRISLLVFVIVAAGALGSIAAGVMADNVSKEVAASIALLGSGAAALSSPWLFGAGPIILVAVLVFWGATVVADSAQFSALVADHADVEGRGTALTLQTALGFALTLVSIRLVGRIGASDNWQWAFLVLAPGPFIGAWAMRELRRAQPATASPTAVASTAPPPTAS